MKIGRKFHSLACNISGFFCATKTVISIMKSAIPEQNFEHLIIYIALFKQKLWYFRHFQFFGIFKIGYNRIYSCANSSKSGENWCASFLGIKVDTHPFQSWYGDPWAFEIQGFKVGQLIIDVSKEWPKTRSKKK
jgi:hypothetical protein